jgi:hypothetical protein
MKPDWTTRIETELTRPYGVEENTPSALSPMAGRVRDRASV